MAGSAFARQTSVTADPERPGRYRAVFNGEWNAPFVPQGGVAAAVALRAMATELGPGDQQLRSVTTVFASEVRAGPAEIDVKVLRRGRTMSQVMATLRTAGEESGHTSVAVFGSERAGFEFTDLHPPVVDPPERCPSFRDPLPEGFERQHFMTFWEQVEGRPALGHAPWDVYEPTTSERAYWYRFDEVPRVDGGVLDPLALVALCDTMPGAVSERMGPGSPPWVPPSADLTVHILGEAESEWLLAHNRARHAGDGYASVDMALWDPARGLVAYGTQMMFFVFPEGPPTAEQRRAR
jgi:acyl-CoA thioesterase